MGVILLYCITVLVDLVATYVVQSFLRFGSIAEALRFDSRVELIAVLGLEVLKVRVVSISASFILCADLGLFPILLSSLHSESFKSMNILVESYLALYKSIPSTREATLITLALLACPRQQCQILILQFLLTRCIAQPRPLIAID